jgi:ABC-type transport system involved in Fe-S cluster assembly fused permease/ATPase subunit
MFNICYAKPTATDKEVHDTARAAQIHERILEFPDGYNSRVGERASIEYDYGSGFDFMCSCWCGS